MFEKFRKSLNANPNRTQAPVKKWLAIIIFGAIIAVFALFGINSDQYGQSSGGVAATVNSEVIPLKDFYQAVENREANLRQFLKQLPEAQRRMQSDRMRADTMRELLKSEIAFQQAQEMGIVVPDAKIQDLIVTSPILQENGRFKRERYDMLLQSRGMSGVQFEQGIRKQMAVTVIQQLFVGASMPTEEELRRSRMLASQKVNVRFAEVAKTDLSNPAFVPEAEVQDFLKKNKDRVESYYKENKIEFVTSASVKSRHILLRPNDKRDDSATAKAAQELRKQATPANFAALASKHSEDPGSKAKGGELPEFEKNGGMVTEFANAAFATKAGQISEPVKTSFGYHLIYVESKKEEKTLSLEEAQSKIAAKLVAREKGGEIAGNLKKFVESGNKKEIDTLLSRASIKWQETGEFDLSSSMIPKIGENPAVIGAIVKRGKAGGLIPELIENSGGYTIAEVVSWKEGPPPADVEGMNRMAAERKAGNLIDTWTNQEMAKAKIELNPRLIPPEAMDTTAQ